MQVFGMRFLRRKAGFLSNTTGSQLLEFAVALPLLVVFVVGIFDFGEAFNVKQKMNNIRPCLRMTWTRWELRRP